MATYLRHIIFLIFFGLLVGCSCTQTDRCSTCPTCPCDPCATSCPPPRDCGPTVEQLNKRACKSCALGVGVDFAYELRKKGIDIIEIGDNAIIILPADKLFEVNCQAIREDAYGILNCLVEFLKCYGCVPLYISGHTDNVAPNCYNLRLSDMRAQTIQAYLWIRGIQFRRMCSTGCGNCVPIANQVTVAGNAANRRIEIRIRKTGCFA